MKKLSLIFVCIFFLSSCQIGRFIFYNFADVKDHKKFPKRDLKAVQQAFEFPIGSSQKAPKEITPAEGKKTVAFEEYLEKNKTLAFLIIHKDSIQYENYFKGYEQSSIVPSFSMAKSVLSMLMGIAIEEGYIHSVQDPIGKYIPDLEDEKLQQTTIEELLQMTSGIDFNESYYNPFGDAAAFYYGRKLEKKTKKIQLKETSAKRDFEYTSGSSQLLGLVLANALKNTTISAYAEEKLWQPLEMQYDASWSLDKNEGLEKTFCCLNATAIDYAKLGRLYLNNGKFRQQQIVSEEWVKQSTKVDTTNGSSKNYQYQWWIPTENGDFLANGILGQYIYVNPKKELIIVRLGKNKGDVNWPAFFVGLAENY